MAGINAFLKRFVRNFGLKHITPMSSGGANSPHSHIPYGPDGSGFYSDNTLGVYHVIQESLDLVLQAIKSITVTTPDRPFVIADYGCADGGTSMPMLRACVEQLRKIHGCDLAINVMYEDQPVNDFKSLFMRLQGLIPGPRSYYQEFSNVFVSACGTSFYKQCFPRGTVNLAFSSTAMHWLQKKPCNITGALHHTMITVPEELEKFKVQAEKDWETILLNRAKELAPGGKMVTVQFTVDEKGQFLGNTKNVKNSMFDVMTNLWKGMVSDGTISEEEFHNTTFINYYRTVEEYKKPFINEDSLVYKSGLSLVSIETKLVPCPYNEKWRREKGDPKAHAQWFIPTTRTWSNSTFLAGLSDKRSSEVKAKIVDELFKRYEQEVAADPEEHAVDYVHAYIVIEKKH